MKKIIIVLSITLAAILGVYVIYQHICGKQMLHKFDLVGKCQSENRARALKMFRERGWVRETVSRRKIQVDVAMSNALVKSFAKLNKAYADSNIDDLSSFAASIPSDVTNITDKVFSDLCNPIYRRVYDDFWHIEYPHGFVDERAFYNYCKKHIYISRFLANMRLLRQEYGYILPTVETDVLITLTRYKEYFDRNNMVELSKCAIEFIEDWTQQIESKGSFTRQYVLADIALQLLPCNEADISCELLLKSARYGASALLRAGYTPKWLDKDFPPLPEEKEAQL